MTQPYTAETALALALAAKGSLRPSDITAAIADHRTEALNAMADRLERENPDRGADFSAGVDWAIDTIRSAAAAR